MNEKRGRGRPRAENPREIVRGVRFDVEEDALVRRAADAAGSPVSAWIRACAVAAARRRLS